MKTVTVAICISSYNDFTLVDNLLTTIRYYTKYPLDNTGIVVCDDGSREEFKLGLRHVIKKHQDWHKNLHLIEHFENQGISATWNHLWQFFNSQYTVILNNDILVTKNWLRSMIYFLERNEGIGACSLPSYYIRPTMVKSVIEEQDTVLIQTIDPITREPKLCIPHNYQKKSDNIPGRVMAPAGMCFATTAARLKEVGGFDEARFRSFYEEIDFGTKCASLGYPSYSLPFPYVYHIWGYTFAQNPELEAQKVMTESRVRYVEKWGGDIDPKDPNNPHPRFMSVIAPKKLRWLDYDSNEEGFGEKSYEETWKDVEESATVGGEE